MEILSLPENEPFITGIEESIDICFNQIMKLADASIFHCRSGKAHIEIVSIRPRACFFPLFSFLPLWLHYNLNPLCVQY